jgi:NAD(P)-dependent dehydrogenase (short-subunit alcohol dehydrogenase family)
MTAQAVKPVALITGGATGIGFAAARVLYEKGYAVPVTGANPETLAAAQKNSAARGRGSQSRRPRPRFRQGENG